MKGKPQDYMSVGIVLTMAFPEAAKPGGPMLESVQRVCTDDYFGAIEVSPISDESLRGRCIEAVQKARKRATLLGQGALLAGNKDLNSLDPAVRQEALDLARGLVVQAKEWGVAALSLISGPDSADRAQATSYLNASLKEICEVSRRLDGPQITLETFDRVPYGKNRLMGPTVEAANLANRVSAFCPRFGLMLDLSHLPLLGETPEKAIRTAGPFLKHVHIGNCVMRDKSHPTYGDNHPPFGIPEGENGADELAAFLKVLLDIGYIVQGGQNIVSFEVKPFGGWTSDQTIENAKQTLDEAWKAL